MPKLQKKLKPPMRLTASALTSHIRQRGIPIAAGSVRRWARDGVLPHARTITGRLLFEAKVVDLVIELCTTHSRKAASS